MSRFRVSLFIYQPEQPGDPYMYAYTGGGGGQAHGNVKSVYGQGSHDIVVSIAKKSQGKDDRYRIEKVVFSGRGKRQFSWRQGNDSHVVVIDNDATGPADVEYSIYVQDTRNRDVFICDPMIKNVPPS
ncbi:MAG: hypothetical protein ABIP44_13035 [Pseudoxanthomonas sp.]